MMAMVTSKGQITLPKSVRDALGLQPGSEVDFQLEQGGVMLRKRIRPEVFDRWQGFLRDRIGGRTTDEIMEELRGE
jgi:antitoxin PrlF